MYHAPCNMQHVTCTLRHTAFVSTMLLVSTQDPLSYMSMAGAQHKRHALLPALAHSLGNLGVFKP